MGATSHASQGNPLNNSEMQKLVLAARDGDSGALEELVRATYGSTYTLAYRLTGNDEDASDVVQDVYLRAWRGLRRFRGDAQFTTWLYRITANCSANQLARRARHRSEPLGDDLQPVEHRPEGDPELQVLRNGERIELEAALSKLPPKLRQVLVLRDIYDLAHSVIAKELGISEAAAKVRVHRARRQLRDVLASAPGDPVAVPAGTSLDLTVEPSGASGASIIEVSESAGALRRAG